MQLLGKAKFLTEDENPKGKMRFPKGSEFPKRGQTSKEFPPPPPGSAILLGISPPWGKIVGRGGKIPGTPVLLNSRGCEFSLRDCVNTITQLLRLNFMAQITRPYL